MNKFKWQNPKINRFQDNIGTVFVRGPFTIDDNIYDYKLFDKQGEDYCTQEQMVMWDVIMKKDLSV